MADGGPVVTGAMLSSMKGHMGAGTMSFKGAFQICLGGKEAPPIWSGLSLDVQKGFGLKFEEVSPKFLSGHMGVAPNFAPGFGQGLFKGQSGPAVAA